MELIGGRQRSLINVDLDPLSSYFDSEGSTYEELLQLDQQNEPKGVPYHILRGVPTFRATSSHTASQCAVRRNAFLHADSSSDLSGIFPDWKKSDETTMSSSLLRRMHNQVV